MAANLPTLPQLPDTDPSRCIFDAYRIAIAKRVADALPGLSIEQVYNGVDYGKKGVDFTIALPRFKLPGKVEDLAKPVINQFQADDFVASVTYDKGFLHFQLNTTTMIRQVLTQVHGSKGEYGANLSGQGKKVLIEFSSPNIAKEFHAGHLRGTIIGAFLVNLYRACGWETVSMNYLGDWGTQFGFLAVGFERYGSQAELEEDPIQHLFKVYVKINKEAKEDTTGQIDIEAAHFFKRLEDGDEEALAIWRSWRALSVDKYKTDYQRLNVDFDVYTGESEVGREWMDRTVDILDEMGLIVEADGAQRVNLEQWKLGKSVLRKRNGTSIYLSRDIAGAIERHERYKFDKMLYVIGSQQESHFAQFKKVLELMQFPWAKDLHHINHGLVQGMKTRTGNVVFLNQIINEAATVMHEQMQKNEEKYNAVENPEEVSAELGITGIKIQDMSAKRMNNYPFSWDRMTSFEGDTGPYLQYAHARLSSIGRNNPHLLPLPPSSEIDVAYLTGSAHAREIVFILGSYPDVVKMAMRTHEPSTIVTFLFKLSHAISSAWQTVVVKGEEDLEKARAKMWLYECAREVLVTGMKLLTLRPLERM